MQLYGAGFYNWFNGNQSSVFNVVVSRDKPLYQLCLTTWLRGAQGGGVNAFAVNVHGVETVVTGDYTVQAYTPVEEEWFCDGWGAYVGL